MLVLSRRIGETLIIGDDIEITVVDVRGDTVRIGINAPKDKKVHRKEVLEEIAERNIQSTVQENNMGATAAHLKNSLFSDAMD